ncbi:MAG: carboxypeptidase regulatory-like domain-containing protein [Nitrospirae bacterium]|nr:carboxypeptidase regulatory-like domain-containing protein [Nitrospirota bacterium]
MTYYWRIVAGDNLGATTGGPIWSFTTLQEGGKTWRLSGKVTEAVSGREAALAGVTMLVTGAATATTSTNNGGNYSLRLPNGTYTVTPGKSGYTFSPSSQGVTIADGNVRGVDFTATSQ